MNKDNFLFALIGLLVGFISGYLLHEVMAARQPARALPGQAMAAPPGTSAPGGQAEQPPAASQQAGPSMEQVQQLADYVEKNPNDAEAALQLAHLNFDIQNWGRARDLYQRYLELRPENPDVLTDLGVTYRNLQDHERALQLFRRALNDEVEFITLMWFDSIDAVKEFAGEDYEVAVVPPKARAILSRFDARSQHYEVRADRRM